MSSMMESYLFVQVLRDHIDRLQKLLGDEWPDFQKQVEPLLRELVKTEDDDQADELVNQILELGKNQIRVIHTPGHTPGSVCFLIGHHLIAGDTLFPGGPGKTGSPRDFEQILESITQKIYPLPDHTVCYSGHGPNTTVGESKREYRIFAEKKRTKPVYGDVEWLKS